MKLAVVTEDKEHVFEFEINNNDTWYEVDGKEATDTKGGGFGAARLKIHASGDVWGELFIGKDVIQGALYDINDDSVNDLSPIVSIVGDTVIYTFKKDNF